MTGTTMSEQAMAKTFAGFMAAFAAAQKSEDEATRKKQTGEALDRIAEALTRVIERFSDEERALRQLIWRVTNALYLDDPYDKAVELDEECDRLREVLVEIRGDIRKGDIEHAVLLVDYEVR